MFLFVYYTIWLLLWLTFSSINIVEVSGQAEGNGNNEEAVVSDNKINLPFNDINLVVVTDVHSWVAGHHGYNIHDYSKTSTTEYDVTYGDVVSFYEHLKKYVEEESGQGDIWFVQNGDWIDGTGLAMDGNPSYLIPLIQKMPFSVLNTGNHELYRPEVVEYMTRPGGFIDWWGPKYLASNVYVHDEDGKNTQPLGNKYTMLEGKHSTIIVFGFIYDLGQPNNRVSVHPADKEVQNKWFHTALTQNQYDAILVMVHAGHDDPAVTAIHQAIRSIIKNDNMPIQFIAGHTHYRRFAVADPVSTIVEAGKYLDTVGFVSFPTVSTVISHKQQQLRLLQEEEEEELGDNNTTETTTSPITTTTESPSPVPAPDETTEQPTSTSTASSTITTTTSTTTASADMFEHVFLDANVATLQSTLGLSSVEQFETPYGKEINAFIDETRTKMGLTNKIGCAPKDYILNVSMTNDNSLWKLFQEQVAPHQLLKKDDKKSTTCRAILIDQGSWRYDLYGGNNLAYDNIIAVSPFNQPMFLIGTVPGKLILELNTTMNEESTPEQQYYNTLPAWILTGDIDDPEQDCELYSRHFNVPPVQESLRKLYPDLGEPIELNITSTSIWLSFVIDQWHCFGVGVGETQWWSSLEDKIPTPQYTIMEDVVIVVIIVCVFTAIFGLILCCYRLRMGMRNEKQYGDMMTAFQDDNDDELNGHHDHHRYTDNFDNDDEDDDLHLDTFVYDDKDDEPPIQIV